MISFQQIGLSAPAQFTWNFDQDKIEVTEESMPVFVFHGGANSRLLWKVIPDSPFLPNVRLIEPDRPGFGKTNFVEGVTTLENWPKDIAALADSLGIDKFIIFGPSGGGPYALACA